MKASSKYGSPRLESPSSSLAKAVMPRKTVRGRIHGSSPKGKTALAAAPKLPHERDETPESSKGAVASKTVQQAFSDVTHGLPDTDRGAEVSRTYQKQQV
jgi:hypothetical protein